MKIMFRINFETINWFVIFNLITKAICLKDLRINVPDAVAVGETVSLSCVYDLEQAALYSVRWYLENEEFYRYVPKEKPPGRIFPIAGLQVDLRKSTETNVVLRAVKRNQSGNYQCEVSADAPLFHTESRTAALLVAELPESEPILTIYGMPGIENQHVIQFGETFRAGCVSGHSSPPVNFTWIINGIRFPSTNSGIRLIDGMNNHEVWSEIMVKVDSQIMKSNQHFSLIVRCETSIFTLYRGAAETELNIIRDIFLSPYEGKISPTLGQRDGSSNSNSLDPGDPGNSALTGSCGIRPELFLLKYFGLLLKLIVNL